MRYEYIKSEKNIDRPLKKMEACSFLFLDTEVAVKNFDKIDYFKDKVRLIQIGTQDEIFIFDAFHIPEIGSYLKPILEKKGVVGHNLKFDIKFLKTNFDILPRVVFDTMIASQILSEGKNSKHSLLAVSLREADFELDKSQQKSAWHLYELTPQQVEYAAKDVEALRRIFPLLKEKLNNMKTPHKSTGKIKEIFGVENPVAAVEFTFVPNLALIELKGMPVDKLQLENMLRDFQSKYQRLYIEFVRKYNIDPFSPAKVANWIVDKLGIKLPKTQKGALSSQDKVLKKYHHIEPIKELSTIRTTKKLLDKLKEINLYVQPDFDSKTTGRIRSQFRQIGAPTGRMSSFQPNLQNVPPSLKHIFKPSEKFKLIVADYSQIELRIAAEYTKDEVMISAFKEGKDLHRFTASLITGKQYEEIGKDERQLAKAINFGLIYGMSPKSLMEYAENNYGIHISLKEAKDFHEKFFQHYKNFKLWHEKTKEQLAKHREIVVESLLGRKIRVSRFTDAVNYPIQATGSDMLKMAVNFFYLLKDKINADVVNLVHDEIVVETGKEQARQVKDILSESMKRAGQILLKNVPVEFEIKVVDTWAEK